MPGCVRSEQNADEYFVRCPKCGKEFDSRETFGWAPDLYGDPTIESIYCPHCDAGTSPKKTCFDCEERDTCTLEESCEDTETFAFEEFKPITNGGDNHGTREGERTLEALLHSSLRSVGQRLLRRDR